MFSLVPIGQETTARTPDFPQRTTNFNGMTKIVTGGTLVAKVTDVRRRLLAVTIFVAALFRLQAAPVTLAEFPFQYREGLLWIEVNIPQSEEPLNFLLDTGAEVSVINLNTARRIGLKLGQ